MRIWWLNIFVVFFLVVCVNWLFVIVFYFVLFVRDVGEIVVMIFWFVSLVGVGCGRVVSVSCVCFDGDFIWYNYVDRL